MARLKYLLDTNMCIYLMNQTPDCLKARFAQYVPGEVSLSAVTWAELCCRIDGHHGRETFSKAFWYE